MIDLSRPGAAPSHGPDIDPDRWPDVARVPAAVLRRAVARHLVARALHRLPIRVSAPDGRLRGCGGPDTPLLRLNAPGAFLARLGTSGLIGFGESYMAGEWDSPDPVALLAVFAEHYDGLIPAPLRPLRHAALPRLSRGAVSAAGARRNIAHHYDLSNELFALFLDPTLTYSSALFEGGPAESADDLARAQVRKTDRILDQAGAGPGTRLLEIGTGWGALAVRAAERGADVTTVTLSAEQRDLARRRAAAAGVSGSVDVQLRDYREVRGRFDAVVSVEMVEAVGERYWPVFCTVLDRVTVPGGRVALQTITMDDALMRASRTGYTWMHKYIFPGGLIPSVEALQREISARTAFTVADRTAFGGDYARTLHLWRRAFEAAADEVAELGFDAVFRRMWSFYLAYCEAGFRAGMIDVEQITLHKEGR
ncbi:class I SAM-dependent methyltransferase [Nocardiopsis coralliicola]